MKSERDAETVISSQYQEALEYAEQVNLELKKREEKLAVLDREISKIEHELKETSGSKSMLSCNSFKISSLELYKKKLRRTVRQKKEERKAFEIEVKQARERKKQIEEEIKSFDD